MRIGLVLASLAALVAATQAWAQKPPQLYSWNTGWSTGAQGLKHVSGLKCPTAPWKGLGPTAPIGFDSDPVAGVKIVAQCQYYQYWDQGTPRETRFVVNLIRTDNVPALAAGWALLMARRGEPKFDEVHRGAVTYRTATWLNDSPGHRSTMIARGEGSGTSGVVLILTVPLNWPDTRVWPVVDGMFRANP